MGKQEKITVSMQPPAGTAKAILAHRTKLEAERDALRDGVPELALRSAQGDAAAQAELWSRPAKQAGLQFEIDQNAAAYALAHEQDAAAEIAWRASIHSLPPEEAIDGLNSSECCRRCLNGVTGGCVLAGGAPYAGSTCFHPSRFGSLHQFNLDDSGRRIFPHRGHPRASAVFDAACDKTKMRGKYS